MAGAGVFAYSAAWSVCYPDSFALLSGRHDNAHHGASAPCGSHPDWKIRDRLDLNTKVRVRQWRHNCRSNRVRVV